MRVIDDDANAYEVFVQVGGSGKPLQYVGSVRGADPVLAWHAAKEVFTRREDCTQLWVVPRAAVIRSDAEDRIVLSKGSARRYRLASYPSTRRRMRSRSELA